MSNSNKVYNNLEQQIKETIKLHKYDLNIDSEILRSQVNFIFDTNYSIEDINYVLGFLYEDQFNYQQLIINQ